MSIDVMKQALEFCEYCWRDVLMDDEDFERLEQTITTLRAAIEQAEKAEPVAWAISYDGKTPYSLWQWGDGPLLDLEIKRLGGTAQKMALYARPTAQPAEPVECQYGNGGYACCEDETGKMTAIDVMKQARAWIAAHPEDRGISAGKMVANLCKAIEHAEPAACECHRCIKEKDLRVNGIPLGATKMILCQSCGNKRCPHASDHRLSCTRSNEPGQPGSVYTSAPAPTVPTFNGTTARKPADLQAQGWQINGVHIQRQDGDTWRHGAVTSGGMVLWWHEKLDAATAQRQPLTDAQNRSAFEAFVKAEMGDIAVMDAGRYISPKIQNYWRVWQAAHGINP